VIVKLCTKDVLCFLFYTVSLRHILHILHTIANIALPWQFFTSDFFYFFSQFVKLKDHKICKIYKIVKSKGKGKMKILKRLAEVEEERDL
jgi:hypothetical protein